LVPLSASISHASTRESHDNLNLTVRLNLQPGVALAEVAKPDQEFTIRNRAAMRCGVTSAMPLFGRFDARTGTGQTPREMQQERNMNQDGQFEIPKEMRAMAEASFDQARKAFESFLGSAQQTASSIEGKGAEVRASAKDISARAVAFAEKNVAASLEFAEKLLHAKDLTEVMRLHSEYVQGQMKSLAEQASEMGQLVSRAAMEAAKPKS
jgi:phasin